MTSRIERQLWFSLAAPAAAWSIQELASAVIDHAACARHAAGAGRAAMLVVTAAAFVCSVVAARTGLRRFRAVSEEPELVRTRATGRQEMMAFAGLMLGVVFAIGILWTGLPALVVSDVCGAER